MNIPRPAPGTLPLVLWIAGALSLAGALSPAQAQVPPLAEALPPSPGAALLAPERLEQGDPLLVWAISSDPLDGAEARLLGQGGRSVATCRAFTGPELSPPPIVGSPPVLRAYGFLMAIPVDLPPGNYRVFAGPDPRLAAEISVEARLFPSEDIPLDAANTRLRAAPDPRKEEEARKLAELIGRSDADALYLDGSVFMLPLVPRRKSAGFGDRRRYLYQGGGSDSSLHAGLDLAVASGTEVDACGPGKVVLTADRVVTGLTVVVEHLPGLYSLYMHLSVISVVEGQVVERGAVLGLSGSTGLSTGPHLHWELRAKGQAVDPEYWLSCPPLDKDRAAAIIMGLIEGR